MTSRLVVYGTGGMGREALQLAFDCHAAASGPAPIGFLDDSEALRGTAINGHPVLGGAAWLQANPDAAVVVAIGSPATRQRVVAELERVRVFQAPALVHPSAVVGAGVSLGAGALVCAGAIVTTNVYLGRFAIVNLGCTLSHDVVLGDYATLACGVHLSGNVSVGEGADIGVGANAIQGRSIGAWSIVGAGTTVVHDVPADTTVVGCPGKVIKTRTAGWQR